VTTRRSHDPAIDAHVRHTAYHFRRGGNHDISARESAHAVVTGHETTPISGRGIEPQPSRRGCRLPALIVAAVLVGCTCFVVAPIAGWVAWATLRASHAADTPTHAATAVLDSLDQYYDEDLTRVLNYLDDDHQDQLRTQLADVRRKLASDGNGYTLEISDEHETQTDRGVTVTLEVAIVTNVTDAGVGVTAMRTQDEAWTFDTINDQALFTITKGWKVTAMRIPDICTVYYTHC
jgi:hypothetical protein